MLWSRVYMIIVQCHAHSILPKQNSGHDRREWFGWSLHVATSKVWDSSYSPHQRKFCTEGLLGRHALGMLERTLYHSMTTIKKLLQGRWLPVVNYTVGRGRGSWEHQMSSPIQHYTKEWNTIMQNPRCTAVIWAHVHAVLLLCTITP